MTDFTKPELDVLHALAKQPAEAMVIIAREQVTQEAPAPDYAPDTWLSILQVMLGQAAHELTEGNPDRDIVAGIVELSALGAGVLDAIDSLRKQFGYTND